jgi:hypothetical protein
VHVDAVRDDLETLVLDADLLEAVLGSPNPGAKAKEIEIKVAQRLRKRTQDPRFRALSERLEHLKGRPSITREGRHDHGRATGHDGQPHPLHKWNLSR